MTQVTPLSTGSDIEETGVSVTVLSNVKGHEWLHRKQCTGHFLKNNKKKTVLYFLAWKTVVWHIICTESLIYIKYCSLKTSWKEFFWTNNRPCGTYSKIIETTLQSFARLTFFYLDFYDLIFCAFLVMQSCIAIMSWRRFFSDDRISKTEIQKIYEVETCTFVFSSFAKKFRDIEFISLLLFEATLSLCLPRYKLFLKQWDCDWFHSPKLARRCTLCVCVCVCWGRGVRGAFLQNLVLCSTTTHLPHLICRLIDELLTCPGGFSCLRSKIAGARWGRVHPWQAGVQ